MARDSRRRPQRPCLPKRHTCFLDPKQYQDYLEWSSGRVHYAGIGARFKGPGLVVLDVFENTLAARAGLQPGDEILAVSRVLDGQVGYVLLRGFPEPSVVDAVEQAPSEFADLGVRGLVLDLRANTGGRLDLGARLLSDFWPSGTNLFEQIDRAGVPRTRCASATTATWSLPLEVLVDEQTASMGEIFAAAVQENGLPPCSDDGRRQLSAMRHQSDWGRSCSGSRTGAS